MKAPRRYVPAASLRSGRTLTLSTYVIKGVEGPSIARSHEVKAGENQSEIPPSSDECVSPPEQGREKVRPVREGYDAYINLRRSAGGSEAVPLLPEGEWIDKDHHRHLHKRPPIHGRTNFLTYTVTGHLERLSLKG